MNALKIYFSKIQKVVPAETLEDYLHFYCVSRLEPVPLTKICRDIILNNHLLLVVSQARKYNGRGVPLEDLIAAGNLGLLYAIQRFDDTKNLQFSTYAVYWIRKYILKTLREEKSLIRCPDYLLTCTKQWKYVERQLKKNLNRTPTETEINNPLKFKARLIKRIHECIQVEKVCSLNTIDKVGKTYIDNLPINNELDELENLEKKETAEIINNIVNTLSTRDRDIFQSRSEGETYEEISKRHNVSKQGAHWIFSKTLRVIQNLLDIDSSLCK